MSTKRCLICGKSFNLENTLQLISSELAIKYSDRRGGVDRCLSCMFPDYEKVCQELKAGDGQRDFFDAEHDIHPDDNYDEEMRKIDFMEQQFGRRF